MKRDATQQNAKASGANRRWDGAPKTYTSVELRASIEVLRETLMEVEALCQRMDDRNLNEITITAGGGAKAFDRIESALNAWAAGLRKALHAKIKQAD